jgi:type IV secretion system protein VirB9
VRPVLRVLHVAVPLSVAVWRNLPAGFLAGSLFALSASPSTVSAVAPAAFTDPRIRTVAYAADEVYRLKGYVGYQIDLEFDSDEIFVGLGSGDLEGLTFTAEGNHLFLKPRSGGVDTNLTVLTNRRTYHFDYISSEHLSDAVAGDVIYVMRFAYPQRQSEQTALALEQRLATAAETRGHNRNYSYRGSPELKPVAAWDDGVEMRLRFASQQELPAVFVSNDDGSESLLNFSIDSGEVVVQRVARHFVVRRGRLRGCIFNQGFTGGGERLESGTVAPSVERVTKGVRP